MGPRTCSPFDCVVSPTSRCQEVGNLPSASHLLPKWDEERSQGLLGNWLVTTPREWYGKGSEASPWLCFSQAQTKQQTQVVLTGLFIEASRPFPNGGLSLSATGKHISSFPWRQEKEILSGAQT